MGRGENETLELEAASASARSDGAAAPPRERKERELSVRNPETGADVPLVVYGDGDERSVSQMEACQRVGSAVSGAMMGDRHVGYVQPIGGVAAYSDHLSPAGAGVDLGCGVTAFKTSIRAADIETPRVMDEIAKRISFGVGRTAGFDVDHEVLDEIRSAEWEGQRALYDKAAAQLGTVGSGNHYVNLLEDEADGSLWISAHFGSRGFGAVTADHFIKLAESQREPRAASGEFPSPGLLEADSSEGQTYWAAMSLAGEYAKAGREIVCKQVLGILGGELTYQANESHNLIWREEIAGQELYVVRKGATPSNPGTHGVIGGSMEGPTVVVEGLADATEERARALNSTVHGAGRVMSRTQAKGKVKQRKIYSCAHSGCSYEIPASEYKQGSAKRKSLGSGCPVHGQSLKRELRTETIREGAVDFEAVKRRVAAAGIELRGAGADEAPEVYKDLDEVLEAHSSQIKILHRLRPIGVAMAGPETIDPYKD